MTHISLPDEQWAELANPRKVSDRKRRAYTTAYTAYVKSVQGLPRNEKGELLPGGYGTEQEELLNAAIDLLVVALVKAWSFEQPVSVEVIGDLPVDVVDVLKGECIKLRDELLPDYSPSPNPSGPTGG